MTPRVSCLGSNSTRRRNRRTHLGQTLLPSSSKRRRKRRRLQRRQALLLLRVVPRNGPFRLTLSLEEGAISKEKIIPQTPSVEVNNNSKEVGFRSVNVARATTKVILLKQPSASMLSNPTWLHSLDHVHPMIKGVFPVTEVISPLAGRIQKFLAN